MGAVPASFGLYQVERLLGTGAYGQTFLVRNEEGERFALKWLKTNPEANGDKRFQNEAWALRTLDHPSIPKYVEKGTLEDRTYIVMSLAEGESLEELSSRLQKEQGPLTPLMALVIAEKVLSALAHIHERGIVHRDVKPANVIALLNLRMITLVDFGVCKGRGQPVDAATFWNAGASRTSPPSKLRHPTEVHQTHDVFSVGVIAYLLLTNRYPWSVGTAEDRGHLEKLMMTETPPPLCVENPSVSAAVSDFFMSLLVISDDKRPSAASAATICQTLIDRIQQSVTAPSSGKKIGGQFSHVMRDPVHGDIPISDYEWRLIGTPEFQRLRWIKQLGAANLVYHGAEHSRFSHAIGTMHVASEVLRRMEERTGALFNLDERLMARAYALVHDITHIPYGHTLEDELGLFTRHDKNRPRIDALLISEKSKLGELLRSTDFGRLVLAHFDPDSPFQKRSWLSDLIEAPSGADIIDYIDRDSLYCGLDHRVDTALYRRFTIDRSGALPKQDRHIVAQLWGRKGIRIDAEFALESLLRERYALFLKVYTHPSKVCAGAMIGKAIREHAKVKRRKAILDERKLEWMSDVELLLFLRSSESADVRSIIQRIFTRDLYTPVFRARALEAGQCNYEQYGVRQSSLAQLGMFDRDRLDELEQGIAKKAGVKPNHVILYCPRAAPGLQKVRQHVEIHRGSTEFRDEVHGPHYRISTDHLRLWEAYVFCDPEIEVGKRLAIAEAAANLLRLRNEVQADRREVDRSPQLSLLEDEP